MLIAKRILFELKKYSQKTFTKKQVKTKQKKIKRSSLATGAINYTSQQSKNFFNLHRVFSKNLV